MSKITNIKENSLSLKMLSSEKHEANLILELLKGRITAQQDLCNDFGKGCTIWVIALGFVLNSAFSMTTSRDTLPILCYGGILFSFLGIAMNYFSSIAMRTIDLDAICLNQQLNSPLSNVTNQKLKFTLIITSILHLIVIGVLFFRLNIIA